MFQEAVLPRDRKHGESIKAVRPSVTAVRTAAACNSLRTGGGTGRAKQGAVGRGRVVKIGVGLTVCSFRMVGTWSWPTVWLSLGADLIRPNPGVRPKVGSTPYAPDSSLD